MKCFEVSAKEGKNVDLIFKEITKLILNNKTEDELLIQPFYQWNHISHIIKKIVVNNSFYYI